VRQSEKSLSVRRSALLVLMSKVTMDTTRSPCSSGSGGSIRLQVIAEAPAAMAMPTAMPATLTSVSPG
jgi:hypothetical protein